MLFSISLLQALVCLASVVSAMPVSDASLASSNPYIAPGSTDSRSPCPGLNTLANHGFIPRNGRNVTQQQITDGFLNGFGMDSSTLDAAMSNALAVCYYVTGKSCGSTFPNLTLLAEPHTLEHDHSFSRQDYHPNWAGTNKFANNQNFNATVFDSSVGALKGASHMDYPGANAVRLTRESLAYQQDLPGWFLRDPIVQGVELGFIFGVMSDPTLSDYATAPKVRVDWWRYWTVNESFPTPLGWKKPSPARNSNFVFSVSSAVYNAKATSTPQPQPPAGQIQKNIPLQSSTLATVLAVPTDAPYVSPSSGSLAKLSKREEEEEEEEEEREEDVTADLTKRFASSALYERLQRAEAAAPPVPAVNPYVDKLSPQQWAAVAALRKERFESIQAALATPAP